MFAYRIHLICLFTFCAVGKAYAQPNVAVYWNPADRQDTVMDFGVTLQGFPVVLTFSVENNSTQTVAVYDPRQDAAPFYQIINVPEVEPQHPRKEEFEALDILPYFVQAGKTTSFRVVFKAVVGNAALPPDSVNEALLLLRVVDSTNALGNSFDKTFLLRALKTTKILASTTPHIRFDSVYVNPKPLIPEKKYVVENVTTQNIVVDQQQLTMQTPVVGSVEFTFDKYPTVEFGPKGSIPWTLRYAPLDKGRDSATFSIVYRPNQNSKPDSLIAAVSGFGVQQQLALIGGTGSPLPVSIRSDTIDFGSVFAGRKYSATVLVSNRGNMVIGYTSEQKTGSAKDTAAFQFVQPLMQGGGALRTNAQDTIRIEFSPTDGGSHVVEYSIETDLLSRSVVGIPDGEQTIRFTVIGFSKRPQIQLIPSQIDFGTLVLYPSCVSVSERVITVRNIGNADLVIDSILVSPSTNAITIDSPTFTVPIASSKDVIVRYSAQSLGNIDHQLILITNSTNTSLPIPATGNVVRPDTISVRVPEISKARPGQEVLIPIIVEAGSVALASTSQIVLTFDPSLMRYRYVSGSGTASEGATVTMEQESPRGVLTLSMTANGNFKARDTFALLSFNTYLGNRAQAAVSLSNSTTKFGNAGCPSALDVHTRSGLFALDSLCGLSFKTSAGNSQSIQVSVFPNPASSMATLVIVGGDQLIPSRNTVMVRVMDSFGQPVLTMKRSLQPEQTSLIPLELGNLMAGMYLIEVQNGIVSYVVPFVVSP